MTEIEENKEINEIQANQPKDEWDVCHFWKNSIGIIQKIAKSYWTEIKELKANQHYFHSSCSWVNVNISQMSILELLKIFLGLLKKEWTKSSN